MRDTAIEERIFLRGFLVSMCVEIIPGEFREVIDIVQRDLA